MIVRITRRRRRGPGSTLCPDCRYYVDNSRLREVVRGVASKGKWLCAECAERKASL